jgi:proteasome lid subunit RPN8/RPN11
MEEVTILSRALVEEMYAHARRESPAECLGLVGGRGAVAQTIYPARNVAPDPLVRCEADYEDLLRGQKLRRERDERLLGIYHSHPLDADPVPSETDVRVAYYPEVIYFIIGFDGAGRGVLRAFRIFKEAGRWFEEDGRWERAEFRVTEE